MAEYVYYQKRHFLSGDEVSGAVIGISLGFEGLLNKLRDENNKVGVGISQFPVRSPSNGNITKSFEELVSKYGDELRETVNKDKMVAVLYFEIPRLTDFEGDPKNPSCLVTVKEPVDVELNDSELNTLDTLMNGIKYERFKK